MAVTKARLYCQFSPGDHFMLKMNLDVTTSSICPSLEQKPTRNIQLQQMLAQVGSPIFIDAYLQTPPSNLKTVR
jgi:hypothetical protein